MILEDNKGNLLGARIADDGQWRFPTNKSVNEKYQKCLISFEDKRFYYHWGIDPFSFGRAIYQNIRSRHIVSGGSTLTMQVVRMARKGQSRTFFEKIKEAILATRLEFSYSKKSIIALYASNAPFGGNVVGLDAASWRYYGKNPNLLSWGEAATLAVLPNSPALIHPGKNQAKFLEKRNRLLDRLLAEKTIDQTTCELSKQEPLPDKPHDLPSLAPHLLDRAYVENFKNKNNVLTKIQTTIDADLQHRVIDILKNRHLYLSANGIHNISAMVIDVEKNEVVSYVGNVVGAGLEHGEMVDILKAPRSSGSILKPILYTLMLKDGMICPRSLISDIPTQMGGFRPINYYETYDGVVPAKRALVRSLNVPFIKMLNEYGVEKFRFWLQKLGFSTINQSATYYGLPLVLGGAETTVWDITSNYASYARTVNHYQQTSGKYFADDFDKPTYIFKNKEKNKKNTVKDAPILNAASCYLALDAMQNVERPTSSGAWEAFQSSKKVAWKTGTSFGFRDAWAVGVTPKYAVGVWVGNADGEGRPELVGVTAAAPILFDIFNQLNSPEWFDTPYDDMMQLPICKQSGYRPSEGCELDTIWTTKEGLNIKKCPFHQIIHLDEKSEYQVTDANLDPSLMKNVTWFMLPPMEEFYYKAKNPSYVSPPPFKVGSGNEDRLNPMQLIYPRQQAQLYIPVDLDGKKGKAIFKATHRDLNATVYWSIDGEVLSSTKTYHNIEIAPNVGKHKLTLVDEKGNRLEQLFEVKSK